LWTRQQVRREKFLPDFRQKKWVPRPVVVRDFLLPA
jgi:hypothetical protein